MTTSEIVMTIFCAVIGSTGIWNIVDNLVKRKQDKQSVERLALKGVLHSMLYDKCQYYIQRGDITLEEFEDLTQMYEPYVELGGNGTIKRLYELISEEYLGRRK